MFPENDLPAGLLFNPSDTVRHMKNFTDLRENVRVSGYQEILDFALVELWIVVRHHRYRYSKLRAAVRALRRAAVIFLGVLTLLVTENLILRA